MRDSILERTQRVAPALEEAFAFFVDPENLAEITPPWLGFRIVEAPVPLEHGALIRYRLRIKGLPVRWLTEITVWQPPRTFTDVQLRGPYRFWEHTHRLTPCGGGTEIYDHVRYVTPGGTGVERLFVRPLLDEIFEYRAQRIEELLGAL
jgi:ligand-binding SRPBCC domain-containing protein